MKLNQKKVIKIPEITYQDKNKLVLKVQSGSKPDKYYYVTITREPPSITCTCISGEIRKYCYHMKEVKGYTTAFIKKRIDMDMSFVKIG